ncbi:sensor histidine kinase [Halohasta salina]|uniref:sensor histidine kinase n=1 Tax=Halohasta salina TaxID=2961621 RepID=UPI0020A38550|nr:histidine kinase N-terminal 7TM domain-containing protein [Halohasta salina]
MGDDVLLSLFVVSLVVVATVVSLVLAGYSWRSIEHPISNSYARLLAADSLWAACYLGMILGDGGLFTRAAIVGQGFAAALAGVTWFLFVIEYTGDSEWIPAGIGRLLYAEAVIYGLLRIVNPGGLVASEVVYGEFGPFLLPAEVYGPIVYAQVGFVYLLLVVSFLLLGRFIRTTRSLYRYQAVAILLTAVAVMVSTLLFVTRFRLHPQLDPTPVLFVFQALIVGVALYRYDFLKIAPVAADRFFREMADPVVILDGNRRLIDYNTAAETIVDGLDPQRPVDALGPEGLNGAIEEAIDARDERTEHTLTGEGPSRSYDIRVTPIDDQFGIAQGYVVALREITERKRRERRLREQNERLEEFADVVSHDLRNPLSAAAGWTEAVDGQLAAEESDIEAARAGLARVERSHERMDELIEMLLSLAREGQTVDDPEPVPVGTTATEAWETADTGEMELVVEADRTVSADPTRLRQVFENLFRNANEHGTATTVTVSDTPEGFVVEDDGEGISAADRESLFEFGYSTDDDGTGIGLAVVKRIVDAHGWVVDVGESDAGGARFEISQP